MTDQENRLYAVNLLNRAGLAFDARDVGVVAGVIAVLEGDVADWLAAQLQLFGSASRERMVRSVQAGAHRPATESIV